MPRDKPTLEDVLDRARRGDVAAFRTLHARFHRSMLAVANRYLQDRESREEVVQDAWEAIIRGIERFEGRSRLSTWIFSIVANKARTRAQRDRRSAPMSALAGLDETPDALVDRFHANGKWTVPPTPWGRRSDDIVRDRRAVEALLAHLETLPEAQRAAITLRDLEGEDTPTICNILGVTDVHLRVLLHRGRCSLRDRLEEYKP